MKIFLKRIWEYFFPPKRFFPPEIRREDERFVMDEVGEVKFFEPVTDEQTFKASKNIDDFLKKITEIKK